MKKTIIAMMFVLLIGLTSAIQINVDQTESAEGLIELRFNVDNPEGVQFDKWAITYIFNKSEITPISQEIFEDSIFSSFKHKLSNMVGVFGTWSSMGEGLVGHRELIDNVSTMVYESTNESGSLGMMTFQRVLDGNITLKPYEVLVNLANGDTVRFSEEIVLEGYVQPICVPNWVLGDYSSCSSIQTAEYTDSNNCGEQAPTPETRSCDSGSSGSSGGSSSSSTVGSTQKVKSSQIVLGLAKRLEEKDRIEFKTASENEHSITVNNIGSNSLTLTLRSNPIIVTLMENTNWTGCIDNNLNEAVYVEVGDIRNGKVNIFFKQTTCFIPTTNPPEDDGNSTILIKAEPKEDETNWFKGVIAGLLVMVVLYIIFRLIKWKKTKQ